MSGPIVLVAAAFAACAALGGCAARERRDVAEYRSVLDAGLAAPVVRGDGPLGVVDSMALASTRNEALAIEGESYVQAILERRRAAAAFLPTLTLAPTYRYRDRTAQGATDVPSGEGGRSSSAKDFDVPLAVGMDLNPVRDTAAVLSAAATIDERRARLLDFQDALLIDVARTHYDIVRSERAVEVLENSSSVQDERVGDARVRLDAGLVSPLDVSLIEAQAAQTAASLTEARVRARNGRSLLAFLVVEPLERRTLADALRLPETLPDVDTVMEQAARRRQDLRAAAERVDAARHLVQSAYGQYFPSMSLNLQWFLRRETEPSDLDWTSLLQVSLPLFSAGLIEADVRQALSILRQAKLDWSLTSREVRRDVEVALENLRGSFERTERRRVQVRAARDALEQAEGSYQVGLATNLERLVAQDAALAAELDLVNAELDTKVFYLDLRRTAGTLHELLGLTRPALEQATAPPDDLLGVERPEVGATDVSPPAARASGGAS